MLQTYSTSELQEILIGRVGIANKTRAIRTRFLPMGELIRDSMVMLATA